MQPDRAFSELIGSIYNCALDPGQWPDVLGEITHAMRGAAGDLQALDPLTGGAKVAAVYNWPRDMAEFCEKNFHISPNRTAPLFMPLLEPKCTSRDLDIDAFWQTCFAGRDFQDYLVVGLSRSVNQVASWGVLGGAHRGNFEDDDLELARLLTPHIKRSVDISGILGHEKVEAGTLRNALDALAAAALIVEPNGAICFQNRGAEAELGRGTIICEAKGRLVGASPGVKEWLAGTLRLQPSGNQSGRDVWLTDASGRKLHATWTILDQVGHELGSPILLMLQEPSPEMRTPIGAAASVYGLTTAETQVLGEILEGRTLAESAGNLGVARSTVKSHLKSLFRKTDTRRQSELVGAVFSLVSPLKG